MRTIVTGADGQLGKALAKLHGPEVELFSLSCDRCDVTDSQQVQRWMNEIQPDAVIHCAAYTNVDRAEREPDICRKINVDGVQIVADVCEKIGAKMILLSTDYVFDGMSETPYETDALTAPLSEYGRSKALAEKIVEAKNNTFIVRTSWMFGDGANFVRTIARLAQTRDTIDVVNDQIGSPTFAEDLALLLLQMIQDSAYGIYHATNEGFCSWAELAQEVCGILELPMEIRTVSSEEYGSPAKRPKNSRLSKACLAQCGYHRLPHWKDALRRYLSQGGILPL